MLDKINSPKDIQDLTDSELLKLAEELRFFLINNLSETGGHLASNLGIVEITLALLKNYDFEKDKIIFDVGHQSYIYKILTGRKNDLATIRTYGGISGFPRRKESKYDFFDSGHASNSISAALGMARARDLDNKDYDIITLIGDGSLTGGMSFEALNDVGYRKSKMLIIFNDNGMAISNNVGSLSKYFNNIRINPFYNKLKRRAHYKLDKHHSTKLTKIIRNVKNSIRGIFLPSTYFENLGLKYVGPIDGHDINKLNKVIKKVKLMDGPVVLHIKTIKGYGYSYAEEKPHLYHGVGKFEVNSGELVKTKQYTYSEAFGDEIVSLAKKNKKIVAITAAMMEGTGLSKFAAKYPKRFFDVGIAEEHAVSFASGLALSGYKPYVAIYSSFLQRAFDQVIEDVCMQDLPVVFMVDRSGLVGEDGRTHHGTLDTSYLSLIPNLTIMVPKCVEDLKLMLAFSESFNHPIAIKYNKGYSIKRHLPMKKFEYGKWNVLRKGAKVAIISMGRMLDLALEVADKYDLLVIDACFIKPIDEQLLKKLKKENYKFLTIEENVINGSLASMISINLKYEVEIIGIDDKYVTHGNVNVLLDKEKFNYKNIEKKVLDMIKE